MRTKDIMVALATSGGSKAGKRKPARKAPAVKRVRGTEQHRDSGAERYSVNRDRNAPRKSGKTKAVKAATRGPKKAPTGMRKTSSASARSQAAASVGVNAYRDYANSMTNLARTGIRGPGFQMPNLNPFDYLGQGLDALGNAITGGVRNTPNPGANIMSQGERIRDVLNGR